MFFALGSYNRAGAEFTHAWFGPGQKPETFTQVQSTAARSHSCSHSAGHQFVEQQNRAFALALAPARVHHTVTRPVKLRRGARA